MTLSVVNTARSCIYDTCNSSSLPHRTQPSPPDIQKLYPITAKMACLYDRFRRYVIDRRRASFLEHQEWWRGVEAKDKERRKLEERRERDEKRRERDRRRRHEQKHKPKPHSKVPQAKPSDRAHHHGQPHHHHQPHAYQPRAQRADHRNDAHRQQQGRPPPPRQQHPRPRPNPEHYGWGPNPPRQHDPRGRGDPYGGHRDDRPRGGYREGRPRAGHHYERPRGGHRDDRAYADHPHARPHGNHRNTRAPPPRAYGIPRGYKPPEQDPRYGHARQRTRNVPYGVNLPPRPDSPAPGEPRRVVWRPRDGTPLPRKWRGYAETVAGSEVGGFGVGGGI